MTDWTRTIPTSRAIEIIQDNDYRWRFVIGVERQDLTSVLALDSVDSEARLSSIDQRVVVGKKIQARSESWDFPIQGPLLRERVFLRVEGQQGHVDVPLLGAPWSTIEAQERGADASDKTECEICYLDLLSALRELGCQGTGEDK